MSVACFSDRYAGGNAGTKVTISTTASYIPTALGMSSQGLGLLYTVQFELTMPAGSTSPAANDTFYLGPLLLGYCLNGYYIDIPAVDSSTGFQIELGDATTAGKYIATGTAAGNSSAATFFISGTSTTVHASLPNFYGVYPTTGSRSQTASATGINFAIGIANDLIMTVTQAASGTYTGGGVIKGFYNLTCAEYPLGTVTSNY